MKMSDVLNEAPKKKPVNKDSWVKKADDAVRKSFPMKAIQTMQGAISRPGPSEKDPSKDICRAPAGALQISNSSRVQR